MKAIVCNAVARCIFSHRKYPYPHGHVIIIHLNLFPKFPWSVSFVWIWYECFGFCTSFMDMIISHNKNDLTDFHEWTPSSENMTDGDHSTWSFSWCNSITSTGLELNMLQANMQTSEDSFGDTCMSSSMDKKLFWFVYVLIVLIYFSSFVLTKIWP